MGDNGDRNAAGPAPNDKPKKHIIRNNRSSNSALKKHKIDDIKHFFKYRKSVKNEGHIGIVFKEVFKLLETYEMIDVKLLTSGSNFSKYHKSKDSDNNYKTNLMTIISKLFKSEKTFGEIEYKLFDLKKNLKGDIDMELLIREYFLDNSNNNDGDRSIRPATSINNGSEDVNFFENDNPAENPTYLNVSPHPPESGNGQNGGDKESIIKFLSDIYYNRGNINNLAENKILVYEPVIYSKITDDAWKSLGNTNKKLHFYGKLNKEQNYTQNRFMTGGSAYPYSLDNSDERDTIKEYINRCLKIEVLYARKHYEYLKLYMILVNLIKICRKLITGNQSLLQTTGINSKGKKFDINKFISVYIPGKLIDENKAVEEQKKIMNMTEEHLKNSNNIPNFNPSNVLWPNEDNNRSFKSPLVGDKNQSPGNNDISNLIGKMKRKGNDVSTQLGNLESTRSIPTKNVPTDNNPPLPKKKGMFTNMRKRLLETKTKKTNKINNHKLGGGKKTKRINKRKQHGGKLTEEDKAKMEVQVVDAMKLLHGIDNDIDKTDMENFLHNELLYYLRVNNGDIDAAISGFNKEIKRYSGDMESLEEKINEYKTLLTNKNTLTNEKHKEVLSFKAKLDAYRKQINKVRKKTKEGVKQLSVFKLGSEPALTNNIKDQIPTTEPKKMKNKIAHIDSVLEKIDEYGKNPRSIKIEPQEGGRIKFSINDEEGVGDLQDLLDKCFNLEQLYALKHYEVMEIMIPIIYYYDVLAKNILFMMYILSLYGKTDEVDDEEIERKLKLELEFDTLIDDIDHIIKEQSIVSDISSKLDKDEELLNNGNMTGGGKKSNKSKKNKKNKKNNKKRTKKVNKLNKIKSK